MIPKFNSEAYQSIRPEPRVYVISVRHPDTTEIKSPIAELFIERKESYRFDPRNESLVDASLELTFRKIRDDSNRRPGIPGSFQASYAKDSNRVSLTSPIGQSSAVFLDPPNLRGHRVGSYLMNEIVKWVRQWQDAQVNEVKLLVGQAEAENKDRRNRFWEQFGLVFDYTDPSSKTQGISQPMMARLLIPLDASKLQNIEEVELTHYMNSSSAEKTQMRFDLEARERAVKAYSEDMKKIHAKPLRWALVQTVKRLCFK